MIDIRYGTKNSALSNLIVRPFTIDGIACMSMEGFLQSLKYEDQDKQKYCCTLHGHYARKYGQKAPDWRINQTLYWRGVHLDRHDEHYRDLIWRAYSLLFAQSDGAKHALLSTGNERLIHSVGHSNPRETILTAKEFCDILMTIRDVLRSSEFVVW
jgi:hypothetical protein